MRFHDRASLEPTRRHEPRPTPPRHVEPPSPAPTLAPRATDGDAPFPCDRCGAGMFRMHSVWRCPACGFKTDCCGW